MLRALYTSMKYELFLGLLEVSAQKIIILKPTEWLWKLRSRLRGKAKPGNKGGQKPMKRAEWNGVGSLWMLKTLLQEKQKRRGEGRGRAKQEKQLCPYLVKGSEVVVRGPDSWVSK